MRVERARREARARACAAPSPPRRRHPLRAARARNARRSPPPFDLRPTPGALLPPQGGCYNAKSPPNETNPCYDSSYCVYDKLFRWIEQAARAAHEQSLMPILSTFADTDLVLDKIGRAGHLAPSINMWAAQLYRGYSFGPWFEHAANASNTPTNFKPFLVTEYGVDAYHDVCGHDPLKTPCFNQLGDSSGSHEDEGTQALWNRNLTIELAWHSSAQPACDSTSREYAELLNLTGDDTYVNQSCVVGGGFVYSWVCLLYTSPSPRD